MVRIIEWLQPMETFGRNWVPGEKVECETVHAQMYVDSGHARFADDDPAPEVPVLIESKVPEAVLKEAAKAREKVK